jgi:AAA ATPase domain
MQFLTAAHVRDFRSIARADVHTLADVVPLVGLNGSGKSNFLRALNLFFNGVIEGNEEVRLRRDFREPGRKAKLRIVVDVDLDYAAFDALRPELEEALETLADDSGEITFRKEWTLDPVTHEETLAVSAGCIGYEPEPLKTESMPFATRLLNAVRFRYIPNHVHPSEILRAEQDSIRKVLQDRLGQRRTISDEAVAGIAEVAADLMRPITEAMEVATGEVADVELATPKDWKDLAWGFGLKLQGAQSQSFEALLHGSGVQSALAFHVLHQIDTTFSGSFGWRKGAIWAIEEPESFLHAGLQGELARSFAEWAESESLQLLLSTHSVAFLGAAEEGLVVEMDDAGRSEFEAAEKPELLRRAYAVGAAPYAHPLHTGPPRPLLLVEGETDRILINRAYSELDLPAPYEILCLKDFDEDLTGGEDQVASWLSVNKPAIRSRPESSPIFVLLDWESSDKKLKKVDDALAVHTTSRCLRWPKDLTNADLSDSWVGIERFLSTSFVEYLQKAIGLKLSIPARAADESWIYDVKRSHLKALKAKIHAQLASREDPADIELLLKATGWLTKQLTTTPTLL